MQGKKKKKNMLCLYILNPLFEGQKRFFKEVILEYSAFVYVAVSN
jgi:hypothetical protein